MKDFKEAYAKTSTYKQLARKHRNTIDPLVAIRDKFQKKMRSISMEKKNSFKRK